MLSDSQIRALKISDRKRHADRDGLVLEIRQNKSNVLKKVFLFRFQWNKKPQTITIGNYPSISLLKAREIASQYRDLINNGIDPRVKTTEVAPTRITFGEVAHQWFQKNQKAWKDFARNRHLKSITRDMSLIVDKPIDDVTTADLISVLKPHEDAEHHDVSHRLCSRLQAIFEYAVASSFTKNHPFIGLKGTLQARPDIKHQPAIDLNEAHTMLMVLKNSNASKIVKLYIELLAHLFVRPSELRMARWSEFNLKDQQQAEWNIPKDRTKMKKEHWVPLSPYVISLLKELRLLTGFTPYLFTSSHSKAQQPISETSIRKLLHKSGYKNIHTAHGFRTLASSVLHEQSNFKIDAIEGQMAHKIQGVRGIYMRASFKAERIELMNWYSNWLLKEQSSLKICVHKGD